MSLILLHGIVFKSVLFFRNFSTVPAVMPGCALPERQVQVNTVNAKLLKNNRLSRSDSHVCSAV